MFPEDTRFENHILSDDAVIVKKGVNDLVETAKLNEGDKDEEEEIELLGMDVYWRIAKQGGDLIRSPDAPKKKRFAHRKSG